MASLHLFNDLLTIKSKKLFLAGANHSGYELIKIVSVVPVVSVVPELGCCA